MLQGLDTALAVLFIIWVPALAGGVPALIGWRRITSHWSSTGRRTFPKALWALTASICIGPIGLLTEAIYERLAAKCLGLVDVFPLFLAIPLVAGFILDLMSLVMSRDKNAARVAVLIGSIAVASVYIFGFAWLLSTSKGISVWTN
jgi:hypothetical protein